MRIAVLGVGRMGSWLAGLLSEEHEVAICDHNRNKVEQCNHTTVLDDVPEWQRFDPELLVNAVPLRDTIMAYEAILPCLRPECILCDIASVKTGLMEYYLEKNRAFVSVHPMFGPTFADMASLRQQHAIIICDSDHRGAAVFRRLFAGLGVATHDLSFDDHDRMMAYSLTIPFVSTLILAASVNAATVPGTTLSKHIEVARGLLSEDDDLLAEILFNPNSLAGIERLSSRLEFLKQVISGRDYEEAANLFARCRGNLGNSGSSCH